MTGDAELIRAARERAPSGPQGRLIAALADRLEALADAEAWCARLANDSTAYDAGREAERAAIVKLVRERQSRALEHAKRDSDDRVAFSVGYFCDTANAIAVRCESSRLPPHDKVAARMRRLEAALRRLHALIDFDEPVGPNGTLGAFGDTTTINAAMREAKAALEDEP